MSVTVQPGRIDLLLLALAEQACKQYVDPALPIPIWNDQFMTQVQQRIQQMGIPAQPVTHIQVGQLQVPLGVVEWLIKASGIFPKAIGGGNGLA